MCTEKSLFLFLVLAVYHSKSGQVLGRTEDAGSKNICICHSSSMYKYMYSYI